MHVPLYPQEDSIDITVKDIDKVALIDADRFKYVVASNMFYKIDTEGETHSKELLEEVIENCLYRYVFSHYKAKAYVFLFSAPSKNLFRYRLSNEKEYKGNRSKSEDRQFYEEKYDDMAYVFKYVDRNQLAFLDSELEADDLISMLQNENTFVHSNDKDLIQVQGTHYDEEDRTFYEVSEKDAFKTLMFQTIKGDTTDNIPGLKRCGPKFVEKLEKFEDDQLITMILKSFTDRHGYRQGLDMFVEMYNLVSMRLRRGKYNESRYNKYYSLIDTLTK